MPFHITTQCERDVVRRHVPFLSQERTNPKLFVILHEWREQRVIHQLYGVLITGRDGVDRLEICAHADSDRTTAATTLASTVAVAAASKQTY
jgi:hypothetical protein